MEPISLLSEAFQPRFRSVFCLYSVTERIVRSAVFDGFVDKLGPVHRALCKGPPVGVISSDAKVQMLRNMRSEPLLKQRPCLSHQREES